MPVPFERTDAGYIIVHDPKYEKADRTPAGSRTVCYARVSSADQKDDLQRQADRLKAFALNMGVENPEVVTETGSGMNDRRRKLNRLLADPEVGVIIVEHRDRLARMNAGLVESALSAQGRRLIMVDDKEMDDDLVRDMTEVLTSFCARLYGRSAARDKAMAALRAARDA
ncbi:integrase [Bifidobacterium eulemuris]|nr:integrase [Bifidobacterium eulemuris]